MQQKVGEDVERLARGGEPKGLAVDD